VEYNLLVRNIERDLLPLAQREGISIIAYRPLAKGSLPHYSGRGKKVLQEMAQKYHKSISQICLNWLISKEPVIAIPKAIDIEHIKENLGAMGWRMKPEDYELLEQAF
jgi:diketogulonate reductase-like aldo/keto reductase